MEYEELPQLTREEAERRLDTDDMEQMALTVAALTSVDDWDWVESKLRSFLGHLDKWVLSNAVIGLSEMARLGRAMDLDALIERFERLREERPEARGHLHAALDDLYNVRSYRRGERG